MPEPEFFVHKPNPDYDQAFVMNRKLRAVAVCDKTEDAEMIVAALLARSNAQEIQA